MLNRRSFVAALATSLTAASASADATAAQECPDLLALSDRLPATLEAYKQATDYRGQIVSTWGPQWPVPHPDIDWHMGGGQRHASITGVGVMTPSPNGGEPYMRFLGTAATFQRELDAAEKGVARCEGLKTKRGLDRATKQRDAMAAKIPHARAYWSEVDRITKASGIKPAAAQQTAAREELHDLVGEILTFEELTPLGLAIKAQAMDAWGAVPKIYQGLNLAAPEWMAGIAATLTRQTA